MIRILAASDFSDEARPVLDFAANMVNQCGGKMYLLHAVAPYVMDAVGSIGADNLSDPLMGVAHGTADLRAYSQDDVPVLELADARAKKLAAEISAKWNIPIYGKAEESDDIVDCVHQFCQRHNIDILVIGNRHHSLLSSILLGNTAEKLVRAARIPVTVVPCGPKAAQ